MKGKVKTAENLAEMLEEYAYNVEEGEESEDLSNLYIVDGLCDMQEILFKDGADEGRFYEGFMLSTDQPVKLFETVEVTRFLSETKDKLKVMAILDVQPSKDGKTLINFLASKVRE